MLWAWEKPQDLRTLDTARAGVAFLAQRVFVGRDARVIPRQQPIRVPEGVYAVAVTRVEAHAEFADSEALRARAAAAIVSTAHLAHVRGVQIDFDATPAQRAFYADVLQRVRAGLPAGMPLTMTALVSWCAEPDGWLHNLPVDQAVPMRFRLGAHVGTFAVREPLCAASVGLSTDEPEQYPVAMPRQVYLFSPKPWSGRELSLLNQNQLPKAE